MKVAIFGGSFDPVHREHVRLVRAAIDALALDRVIVVPSSLAPHKSGGAHIAGEKRLEMCKIAFRDVPGVEVSDFELLQEGTSYTYLTCRQFAQDYPHDERYLLVGADMLEDFFTWKNPDEILRTVSLCACSRGEAQVSEFHGKFRERFGVDFLEIPFLGAEVSSTELRVALAFRSWVNAKELCGLDGDVLRYIDAGGLYRFGQDKALGLEKQSRREHSYRVARMACARAHSLGISENQALLAAMLHDCGKEIPADSPLLKGASLPKNVPDAVMHQYIGAVLAEFEYGVKDADVLAAIRFHTSGRAGMSALEKLIYLSDLLEDGRNYEGVQRLRGLFYKDIDMCLKESLREQILYLKGQGKFIYALTEDAYRWISEELSAKK